MCVILVQKLNGRPHDYFSCPSFLHGNKKKKRDEHGLPVYFVPSLTLELISEILEGLFPRLHTAGYVVWGPWSSGWEEKGVSVSTLPSPRG